MVNRHQLLENLPPYRDEWVILKRKQYVPDIQQAIYNAAQKYRDEYDKISSYFLCGNGQEIADNLYWFCRRNIRYREEPEQTQTVSGPVTILSRGYGDCKHYALFCAGILDSLNRVYGVEVPWWYYFAGYDGSGEVYHVFTAIRGEGHEVWIDPSPGAVGSQPTTLKKMYV